MDKVISDKRLAEIIAEKIKAILRDEDYYIFGPSCATIDLGNHVLKELFPDSDIVIDDMVWRKVK